MQSEYLRATSKDDSSSGSQRGDKSEVSKLISDKARVQEALEAAQVNSSVLKHGGLQCMFSTRQDQASPTALFANAAWWRLMTRCVTNALDVTVGGTHILRLAPGMLQPTIQ